MSLSSSLINSLLGYGIGSGPKALKRRKKEKKKLRITNYFSQVRNPMKLSILIGCPTILEYGPRRLKPLRKRLKPLRKKPKPLGKRLKPLGKRPKPLRKRLKPLRKRLKPLRKKPKPLGKRLKPLGKRPKPLGKRLKSSENAKIQTNKREYIEDITRWREDMDFKTIFYE